jgi:hypothetical protein
MIVGSLVLIAYIALTIVNVVQLRRGRTIGFARQLSMAAALLLLIQIVLGFNLLAGDGDITVLHYLFALATLITVGAEHGMANSRPTEAERLKVATLATAGTTILVFIAYLIGETSA